MSDKTETQQPTEGGSSPRTCSRSSRQTLAYSKDHEGQYLDNFPLVYGMKCTGWSASDLFEDYEDAMKVLAKIAVGDIGYGDAEELAKAFFEQKREQPYSYYDPDDEDEESSENVQPHPVGLGETQPTETPL